MLKKVVFIAVAFIVFSGPVLHGQGIKGTVVDTDGNAIPYASIFIKELKRGTTTNSLGLFSLPLPSGDYTIFFRSLGYTEVFRQITLGEEFISMDIEMPPQTYMIPEVRVSASGEDPAYRIMRKAIGLANYHLNQVSTYNAEIYIKGTAYFHKLPRAIARRIEVGDIKVEEDRAYMLESLNDVTYTAPDRYDMRIIASQNTIPGYVERVNPMDYINASLYQQQIESIVSPLARNAFFYYDFNFEGSFLQGNHMIAKIRVIPKRKSQQVCSGYLYIVEDLWCLHSSDLVVNTIAGDLLLQQQYANVIMDAWLPVSHKLDLDVEIAGVDADVTYVSSLKYKKTVLNPNLPSSYFEPQSQPEEVQVEEVSEEQEKIQEILEKEEIDDRDMARLTRLMEKETQKADSSENKLEVEGTKFSVAPNAVTTDSLFWNDIRPVPLTFEEKNTLVKRDSLLGTGGPASVSARDSIRRSPRRPTYRTRDFIIGKTFQSANRKLRIIYGGLFDPSMFSFNTVDGFIYGQDIGIDYRPDFSVAYRSNIEAGYAFARNAPFIYWNSDILYAAPVRAKIALRLHYKSEDYNGETGIPLPTNTAYSLFYRENYSKRYERIAASLEHRMDVATGLVFYATMNIENRRELTNNSSFSILFRNSKNYSLNNISHEGQALPGIADSKILFGQVRFEYTHEYYYRLRRGRKQYFKSDYPTVYAIYKQAFPVKNTGWADYNLVYGGLHQEVEVGLLSTFKYRVEGGAFINSSDMHYSDFRHFKTSPLLFDMIGFEETFLLMDHYRASTNQYFVQAHGKLQSTFLALKMLPWFSERLWKESFSVSYLTTSNVNHHIQAGYSMEEIGFLFDVGIYTAFENWKYYGTAVRFYFRF
ncbi:MAG: DUF5686 and carboxypeptidase regulatory-like domain-containing protein [Bacteroidales bacterium]|nr:DUF5686 and carboxypeptidase regulatory-like domain-containing protein [Bacteroidales bacterium]